MIVDVSRWQGAIDWSAAKAAGVSFAWCKATEGIGFVDPNFAANWAGIKAAGIRRGAYYFARPDGGNDPVVEADYFLSVVQPEPEDRLADDLEVGTGNLNNYAYQGLNRIRQRTGTLPFLYSYYLFILGHLSEPALNEFLLWCADYTNSEPTPPPPFTSIALWQYTSSGSVAGIPGRVDLSSPSIYNTSGSGSLEASMNPTELAFLIIGTFLGRLPGAYPDGTPGEKELVRRITANPADLVGETIGYIVNSPEGVAWLAKLQWLRDNLSYDPTSKAVAFKVAAGVDDDSALATRAEVLAAFDALPKPPTTGTIAGPITVKLS